MIRVTVQDSQGRAFYEFGPENDDECLRWEIGRHGQLAITKQIRHQGVWIDDAVLHVFNANFWMDLEIGG